MSLSLAVSACAWRSGTQDRPFVAPPRPSAPAAEPADRPGTAAADPAPPALDQVLVRVRVTRDQGSTVVTLPLDAYVLGSVRAELLPRMLQDDSDDDGRFLQVQAIVSRTYAVAHLNRHQAEGFDLCDSTHCQLYRGPLGTEHERDAAARAVAKTSGQIVTFEGRPIQAVYHSNCGGHTTAAENVWSGAPVPYLRPVPDWFCSRAANPRWEFSTDEQQLRRALNADARTSTGGRLDRISVSGRDAAGRATRVALTGARSPVVKAEEFRAVMRQAFGARSIRSTVFSVTRNANVFTFSGVGHGHGVGLCQTGAELRAKAGQSPATVLAHYYPGTSVESVAATSVALALRALPSRQ